MEEGTRREIEKYDGMKERDKMIGEKLCFDAYSFEGCDVEDDIIFENLIFWDVGGDVYCESY